MGSRAALLSALFLGFALSGCIIETTCGYSGDVCCGGLGGTCNPGLVCSGSGYCSSSSTHCGSQGEACCTGGACNLGLTCAGGFCTGTVMGRAAYDRCSLGQSCQLGTNCLEALFVSGMGSASLCTVGCTPSYSCPGAGAVCVINAGSPSGQCYLSCLNDANCRSGTVCRTISGTTAQVCVPVVGATAPTAYVACTPAGSTCVDGTLCTPALAVGAGTPQGNTCTASCPSGVATSCPAYVAGQVECVQVNMQRQCVRLCNSGADCTPFNSQCLQVTVDTGHMIRFCAP